MRSRLKLTLVSVVALRGSVDAAQRYCEADLLPSECRGILGKDSTPDVFERLLSGACELCPPEPGRVSRPCREDEKNSFADLALEVIMYGAMANPCTLGFVAGYLITVQYSAANSPFELPEALLMWADTVFRSGDGFDLAPYPFWSELRPLGAQIRFHMRFFSVHLHTCNDQPEQSEAQRGLSVLRASHTKPECACASRSTDMQLVKRCRRSRRAQKHPGMRGHISGATAGHTQEWPPELPALPDSIQCPDAAAQEDFERRLANKRAALGSKQKEMEDRVQSAKNKYTDRANVNATYEVGMGCESLTAEWRQDLSMYHKCILVVVMERLQLPPGALVLDWGSGCGHKLGWASQLFGTQGLGIDVVADNVAWAKAHSAGKYCHVDGRFVEWLPDDAFDGIISYAALAHLDPIDQCDVLGDLIGKLRVGGHAWFGWNAPGIWHNNTALEKQWMLPMDMAWTLCFDRMSRDHPRWRASELRVAWETIEEAFLFPAEFSASETYLYWYPAYSLFLTRLH